MTVRLDILDTASLHGTRLRKRELIEPPDLVIDQEPKKWLGPRASCTLAIWTWVTTNNVLRIDMSRCWMAIFAVAVDVAADF